MSDVGIGIHPTMPFDRYAEIRAVNSGVVKWGAVSMKHMQAAFLGQIEADDTKDRKFGRAIHCRLLEPERYRSEYLIATPCKAVKQDGQECGNTAKMLWDDTWYCGVRGHAPKEAYQPADYVSESEAAGTEAIAAALHNHDVMRLFRGENWCEVSCVWEWKGVLRKCRIDLWSKIPKPRIIDIKKMQVGAGGRESCEKAILNYGYHRQMAGNIEAIESLEGVTPEGIWVFIEDGPPYDVQVMPADEQTIAIGRFENNDIIGRFAAAQNRDDYRGYIYDSRFIRYGGLPLWYREQCARLGIGTGDSAADIAGGGTEQPAEPEYAEF